MLKQEKNNDSRFGWERRMEYRCDESSLQWMLQQINCVKSKELVDYKKSNRTDIKNP